MGLQECTSPGALWWACCCGSTTQKARRFEGAEGLGIQESGGALSGFRVRRGGWGRGFGVRVQALGFSFFFFFFSGGGGGLALASYKANALSRKTVFLGSRSDCEGLFSFFFWSGSSGFGVEGFRGSGAEGFVVAKSWGFQGLRVLLLRPGRRHSSRFMASPSPLP